MYRLPNITPGQNRARLRRAREYMVVGSNPSTEHSTKELEGKRGKLILGKGGDHGAPSGGRLTWGLVENLAGKEGQLGLGVEVYEVMGNEGDGLEA